MTLLLFVSICFGQYNYGLEVEQHDAKIEGKLNLNSGSRNIFIGHNSGINIDNGTFPFHGMENTFLGYEAGKLNTIGYRNTYIGFRAGIGSTQAHSNICIGYFAGSSNTSGFNNVFIGNSAGFESYGTSNTFLGHASGNNTTDGNSNTFVGAGSGQLNTTGISSTYLGESSGFFNITGSRNVFVGFHSGRNETNSDRLYIESSGSSAPLIYGEFDNDKAGINWDSTIPLPATLSVDGTLHISETAKLEPQAGPPSTCMTSAEYGLMYYDSSSTTHKLKVCTNAGWEDLN